MPTATALHARSAPASSFALRGVAWSLALFGLLRLTWFETHAVLPLTHLQERLAAASFGAPVLPIQITLACSGADALALCAGAILAYPAAWRMRLGGVAGGIGLILALNTVRIGTLGRAVGSSWFDALHVYAWPALLTLAIAGYVFAWMRAANARTAAGPATAPFPRPVERPVLNRRFVSLAAVFLVLFTVAAPLYLDSAVVLALAAFIARTAATGLRALGMDATATNNVLATSRGAFLVTQECISTPLIPLYIAAVLTYVRTWPRRAPALLAAIPIFTALGVARLLVVALPSALTASPLFLIHAFYQLLLAGVLVVVAALWRHDTGPSGWRRAALAGLVGYVSASWLVPAAATAWLVAQTGLPDPQGALGFLPAFQVGLYLALFVAAFLVLRWRPLVVGLAALMVSQMLLFGALHVVVHLTGLAPHVRDVRAWALGAPILIIVGLALHDQPR